MKLNIYPRQRRSWTCIVSDDAGVWVATTSLAKPACLCGLITAVDGTITMTAGAPATKLCVREHGDGRVLVDGVGRQLGTATRPSWCRHKMYVTLPGVAGTVRWAPARGGGRPQLEAVRHEGPGGAVLSPPLGTFRRARRTRCTCTAEFDDTALPAEAQLFLVWLGVQLLHDVYDESSSGRGYAGGGGDGCGAGGGC